MRRKLLIGTVAATAASLVVPAAAPAEPPYCAEGWTFTELRKKRPRHLVHERRREENLTRHTARVTFTSRKSRTVKMGVSVGIEASYGAIFTEVKAKIDASVEKSVTAEVGEEISIPVPGGKAALGNYGVFIRPVTGRLRKGDRTNNCLYDRRVTAYLPRQAGWRVRMVDANKG